jgi:gamma-glutamyltranspeptidase/glutathione hydrolase
VNRGTTHVTVADAEGNIAAMTTSNGECSGDVIEGTGISCNNMLGEDDLHPDGFHASPAGLRVASMMSPTFVLSPGGDVELALGSGGSKRIRSALLQVLTAVIDHGTDLEQAVLAPRIHWDTDHLEAEPGLDPAVLAALEDAYVVNQWPSSSMYFGGVHAVQPGRAGVGDPRRGGAVRVV